MPIANEDVEAVARALRAAFDLQGGHCAESLLNGEVVPDTEIYWFFGHQINIPAIARAALSAAPIERMREALAAADKRIADLKEWALEKCRQHHQLAADDEYLRMEHIATSSAYRELALEIEARVTLSGAQNNG